MIRLFLKTRKLYFKNNYLMNTCLNFLTSSDFKEGEEIPKECGYKFENKEPKIKNKQ